MSDMLRQLREDRALRNAARALIDADVEILKGDIAAAPGAHSLLDRTRDGAVANRGKIGGILALLVGGVLLYIFRDSLRELLEHLRGQADESETETNPSADRSDNEPHIDPEAPE